MSDNKSADEIPHHDLAWELTLGDKLTIRKHAHTPSEIPDPTTLEEAAEQNNVIAFLEISRKNSR